MAALSIQAATLPFPDVEAAKEQAKQTGKPALIVWYGSDWQPNVASFVRAWQQASAKQAGTYVFGQFDEQLGQERDRNKVLPIEHFNLPAAILLAPNGSYMAELSGQRLGQAGEALKKLAPLAATAGKFAELVEKAKGENGAAAVRTAAQALSMLPINDAMRHKELVSIINKFDPQDTSGYRAQFCLDHLGMYAEINGILKGGKEGKLSGRERKFDEAEAYVRKVLAYSVLKGAERRQQWLAGLSYVQRERMLSTTTPENRDVSPLLATFREIIKLDPNSQYAVGAAKFLHYWDPKTVNIIEGGYYTRRDQTLGFEKDWLIDVTKDIEGPGTYVFSLVPVETGSMVSRNFRLLVNGKEVAKANVPETTNTKSVEFVVPPVAKGAKVQVRLTAKCNDGWMEASGFIRMEKKN